MRRILCFWVLVFGSIAARGDYSDLVFGARRGAGSGVELVYGASRWPTGHEGFVIRRRLASAADDDWAQVNAVPVLPRPLAQVDWSALGLAQEERDRLQKWVKGLSERDRYMVAAYRDHADFKEFPGTPAGNLLMASAYEKFWSSAQFNYALAYGLGYVDTGAMPDHHYVYGLHPVVGGEIVAAPVATAVVQGAGAIPVGSLEIEVLTQHPGGGGFMLVWAISREQSELFGIRHFHVYRANRRHKLPSFQNLATVRGELEIFEGQSRFQFSFTDTAEGSSFREEDLYLYKLVPVNLFGMEINRPATIRHPAGADEPVVVQEPEPPPVVVAPVLNAIEFDKDTMQARITWKHEQDMQHVVGYHVERKIIGTPEPFQLLTTDWLPNDARSLVDYGPFEMNTGYRYQVIVRINNGRRLSSRPQYFICRKVPRVGDVSVERFARDGNVHVRIRWDAPPPEDLQWVGGYVIGSAKGDEKFAYFASLPLIKGQSFDHRLYGKGSVDYTFGVAVKSSWGEIGEFTRVTQNIRSGFRESPTRPTFIEHSPNNAYITMTWNYPGDEPVQGYRVYGLRIRPDPTDPVLLFDETQVLGSDPRVRLGPIEPHTTYAYYVKAVDPDGVRSFKSFDASYQYTQSSKGSIHWTTTFVEIEDGVQDLHAEFHEDPTGPDWLAVRWGINEQYQDLVGSFLITAEPAEAISGRLPLRVQDPELRLPVSEDFSGELSIRVQVCHFQGKEYDPVVVTVHIPPRQVQPDAFPQQQVLLYSSVASGLIFIVLSIGLYRRVQRRKQNSAEAA